MADVTRPNYCFRVEFGELWRRRNKPNIPLALHNYSFRFLHRPIYLQTNKYSNMYIDKLKLLIKLLFYVNNVAFLLNKY